MIIEEAFKQLTLNKQLSPEKASLSTLLPQHADWNAWVSFMQVFMGAPGRGLGTTDQGKKNLIIVTDTVYTASWQWRCYWYRVQDVTKMPCWALLYILYNPKKAASRKVSINDVWRSTAYCKHCRQQRTVDLILTLLNMGESSGGSL